MLLKIRKTNIVHGTDTQSRPPELLFPGPATGSFNDLHLKSKFLGANQSPERRGWRSQTLTPNPNPEEPERSLHSSGSVGSVSRK